MRAFCKVMNTRAPPVGASLPAVGFPARRTDWEQRSPRAPPLAKPERRAISCPILPKPAETEKKALRFTFLRLHSRFGKLRY